MSKQRSRSEPPCFETALRRLERWRGANARGTRIPAELWAMAVDLATEHGLAKTAAALRLDYYSLKKRLPVGAGSAVATRVDRPVFVELPFLPHHGEHGCVVELRDPGGLQMRVELNGAAARELPAVALALWKGAR